jgi:diguanylate cyclase (GGDEF)-like protein
MMSDPASEVIFIARTVFLLENIIFTYVFLSPGRKWPVQILAFALTWLVTYLLREPLGYVAADPLLRGYLFGTLYLIPVCLIFRETLHAKIFIFFMIFSLSQFTFLIFSHVDRFLSPPIPNICVLAGLLLELAALPLVRRYMKGPVKEIVGIIGRKKPVFTLFPILSFVLLAFTGVQRSYSPVTFVSLLLFTTLIFFSYYLIVVAISESRRRDEIDLISRTDSLTGIFNRRHVEQQIREEWDRYHRTGAVFSIVIADIDFFKSVNDRYGHDEGDAVLKSVVREIRRSIRVYDVLGRWGGEEFLILLLSTENSDAAELSERIRRTVASGKYGSCGISVTLTMGVSVMDPDDSVYEVIKKADIALYQGKGEGRNRVISFSRDEAKLLPE